MSEQAEPIAIEPAAPAAPTAPIEHTAPMEALLGQLTPDERKVFESGSLHSWLWQVRERLLSMPAEEAVKLLKEEAATAAPPPPPAAPADKPAPSEKPSPRSRH